jgi:hypothetical protein
MPAWVSSARARAVDHDRHLGRFVRGAPRRCAQHNTRRSAASRDGRFLRTSAPSAASGSFDATFAIFAAIVGAWATRRRRRARRSAAAGAVVHAGGRDLDGVSTLVGRYIGAGDLDAARRSAAGLLSAGLGVTAFFAVLFLSVPGGS